MTTTTQKTCAELIESELSNRENHLNWLYQVSDGTLDAGETLSEDEAREEIDQMAYGIETFSVARVIWSGGGPSDFIEITYNRFDLIRVEYVYQDWFDGARKAVEEDSAVWRYAEEILESLNA